MLYSSTEQWWEKMRWISKNDSDNKNKEKEVETEKEHKKKGEEVKTKTKSCKTQTKQFQRIAKTEGEQISRQNNVVEIN